MITAAFMIGASLGILGGVLLAAWWVLPGRSSTDVVYRYECTCGAKEHCVVPAGMRGASWLRCPGCGGVTVRQV